MNYLIQIILDGETIATERSAEHPTEAYLRRLVAAMKADYADVSRI